MTPRELGAAAAAAAPRLTDDQVEHAARVLASIEPPRRVDAAGPTPDAAAAAPALAASGNH